MHFPFFGKNKREEKKDVQDAAAHGVAVLEASNEVRKPFFVRVWLGIVGIPAFFKDTFLRLVLFVILLLFYITVRGSFSLYVRILKTFRTKTVQSSEVMFARLYASIERLFRVEHRESIDRISLIGIAVRNMKVKKTRTAITIGGMAMGIASIVFLVSLGYGVQRLVISQVARLDEMRQTDISPQAGGRVKINDETLSTLKGIPNVESVAPLVAVVGKVNYQGSVSDMAVYAVTSDYLRQSAVQPSTGSIFESNDLSALIPNTETVAGVSNTRSLPTHPGFGDILETVSVRALSNIWVRLRESPDPKSRLLGTIRISEEMLPGSFVAGMSYGSTIPGTGDAYQGHDGETLGKWIATEAPVWEKSSECSERDACKDGYALIEDSEGKARQEQGYFALVDDSVLVSVDVDIESSAVTLDEIDEAIVEKDVSGMVLGESTEAASASTDATATSEGGETSSSSETASTETGGIQVSSSDGDWVEIDLGDNTATDPEVERAALGEAAKREAVVNRAMLQVLGISEGQTTR